MKKNSYYYTGVNPTVDLVVMNPKKEILMITRSHKSEACPGMLAFPGGFIDSNAGALELWESGLETPREAAIRELAEETNLQLNTDCDLLEIGVYEGHGRDPRDNDISWSKSYAFFYAISERSYEEQKAKIKGLDDADEAQWVSVDQLRSMKLAFDHHQILEDAISRFF